MLRYEIINPSDMYTLQAETDAVAAAAGIVVGVGRYAITREDGEEVLPILMFNSDGLAWFAETYGRSFEPFMHEYWKEVADCLDSVLIGGFEDRATYAKGLELIEGDDKRKEWRDHWHDTRRTSVNDIGANAWKLAQGLRESLGIQEGRNLNV